MLVRRISKDIDYVVDTFICYNRVLLRGCIELLKEQLEKNDEMMVQRGEKNTFCDQVFTTFIDLPKAIRITDSKKVFYRESKNII